VRGLGLSLKILIIFSLVVSSTLVGFNFQCPLH